VFRHHLTLTALLAVALFAGCEGARNNSSWSTAPAGAPIVPPLTIQDQNATGLAAGTTATPAAPSADNKEITSGRGIGPVDHVDISQLDAARAMKGADLFTAKCSACHKIEERYIGPALTGVTKRRTPEWICNQILNPENMIQQDPTAKALLAIYIAPMANQHLTREEAESILAYFLQHDAKLGAPEAKSSEAAKDPSQPGVGH
jgi:mono/diheme cytochrome c family protein